MKPQECVRPSPGVNTVRREGLQYKVPGNTSIRGGEIRSVTRRQKEHPEEDGENAKAVGPRKCCSVEMLQRGQMR